MIHVNLAETLLQHSHCAQSAQAKQHGCILIPAAEAAVWVDILQVTWMYAGAAQRTHDAFPKDSYKRLQGDGVQPYTLDQSGFVTTAARTLGVGRGLRTMHVGVAMIHEVLADCHCINKRQPGEFLQSRGTTCVWSARRQAHPAQTHGRL